MATTWSNRVLDRAMRPFRSRYVLLAVAALLVGLAASAGAVLFREAIELTQWLAFGFRNELVASSAGALPWWRVILAPAAGGLLIGLFVRFVMPGGRPQGVAEVIEASATKAGRMPLWQGLCAALASAMSIGCGASVGREGPAVHFGAALASSVARALRLGPTHTRTMLGCGVAAAVAASFNAPIAGAFFALEVVIGHYALQAFTPIVIASVTGTVISRIYFGDFPAFALPPHKLVSFLEFPAFAILGAASGLAAIAFMSSVALVQDVAARVPVPAWLMPAAAGLLVGGLAVFCPEILGVGYEATDNALKEAYTLEFLVMLLVAKTAASALCLGSGFAGGVFSPSLFIGAMLGGAVGLVAGIPFPELHSGGDAYALVGMGAVAGAVLGAPISTILMIFELTDDYKLMLAVMLAVVIASTLTRILYGQSYFIDQLRRRGLDLQGGHEMVTLGRMKVGELMRRDHGVVPPGASLDEVRHRLQHCPEGEIFVADAEGRLVGTITLANLGDDAFDHAHDGELTAIDVARKGPPSVPVADGVNTAMRLFRQVDEGVLAVVDTGSSGRLVGCLHERDVMRAYNRELIRLRAEEHGEVPREP